MYLVTFHHCPLAWQAMVNNFQVILLFSGTLYYEILPTQNSLKVTNYSAKSTNVSETKLNISCSKQDSIMYSAHLLPNTCFTLTTVLAALRTRPCFAAIPTICTR